MARRYSWPADSGAIRSMLAALDPCGLTYDEWLRTGMALKDCGAPFEAWDGWSRRDAARYRGDGGMLRKWTGFDDGGGVTAGTLAYMARERGWEPGAGGWAPDSGRTPQSAARKEGAKPPDLGVLPEAALPEPPDLDPPRQLARYVAALFRSDELVNVVTECARGKDGKPRPGGRGLVCSGAALWACAADPGTRAVGEALQAATGSGARIDPAAGAWVRVNPVDGAGVSDANVTAFRHALVECDGLPRDEQLRRICALNLPCAAIVDSAGKSVHAVVRVDARDEAEYKERVRYLYGACEANGLPLDPANKNPGRLSRLPGAERDGHVQRLVATGWGAESWAAWRAWVDAREKAARSALPELRPLSRGEWDNLPPRAPVMIDGVLRRGHKLMLAGPSKAGKSFALMGLCCAVAEGREWMGWKVLERGPAVYVNLELDARSCHRRVHEIYDALGWPRDRIENVVPWDLRGHRMGMAELADALVERARPLSPALVAVDPIYKVMAGDENSAGDVARMLGHLDRVAEGLGCTVAFAHHFAKGAPGAKEAMDRASGSGSFARDPDALITLTPLRLTEEARAAAAGRPAFRVEGILREFAPFEPFSVWFDHPVHVRDGTGALAACTVAGSARDGSRRANEAKTATLEGEHARIVALLDAAVSRCREEGAAPTVTELHRRLAGVEYKPGKTVRADTVYNWLRAGWCPYELRDGAAARPAEDMRGETGGGRPCSPVNL